MNTAFEDEQIQVLVPSQGVTPGHVILQPKQACKTLEDAPQALISHMFFVASKVGSILFEGLQAKGTNIIIKNGEDDTLQLHIIARFENDGANFTWQPKQGDMVQVKKMGDEIKGALIIGEQKPQSKPIEQSQPKPKQTNEIDTTDTQYEFEFERLP